MNGLKANIYKDICLFLSVSGVLSLLLPLLIAAALLLGLNDAPKAGTAVEPFAVAVYDRDDTVMSRSLVSQLARVDLFSKVVTYRQDRLEKEGVLGADGALREDGLFSNALFSNCAAVITLPADFFYDAYTGDEEPVIVLTNGEMPLEGELTAALTVSISRILNGERAAWYAAYSLKGGGEFDPADLEAYYNDASMAIIDSALGRAGVINASGVLSGAEEDVKTAFFACTASMLLLFVPAGVLKALPDERRIGVSDRFCSLGGSAAGMLFSKLIAAFILCTAGMAPLILLLRPALGGSAAAALLLAFFAGFCIEFALASLCGGTERFMLASGLVTVSSLLFGGVIYPRVLLPDYARLIGEATVPKHLLFALEGKNVNTALTALAIITLIALAAALIAEGVRRARRQGAPEGGRKHA